jgi:asparagine N-glycosylation enzyme membrane subunit Stt3
MPARVACLLLGGVAALAFAVRALFLDNVFPGDGAVLLEVVDGSYHARRALYSFVNFPRILFFDSYLNYPDGAPVPIPPLYDWALAAVARAFGDSLFVFEHVAAWVSPVLGALTVVPVYAAGRLLGGPTLGLGAAAIFALLPVGAFPARVGNPDHHAAQALLGACFLALSLALVRPATRGRRLGVLSAALVLVRSALILTWSGSLLYIAVGEGAILLAALVAGRRELLLAEAAGTLCAALLIAPWVVAAGTPVGGPFSTLVLSWFHVAALAGVAAFAASLAALETLLPCASAWARCARAAACGLLALGVLVALPAVREALAPGLAIMAKSEEWAPTNREQRSLFGGPSRPCAWPAGPCCGAAWPVTRCASGSTSRPPPR